MEGASSPDMATTAALLANETRAAMLLALLDGRAWTATELARETHASRPSVSEHLHRLVAAGLISEMRQGRHRYVRIADPSVAEFVESLAALSGRVRPAASSLRAQNIDRGLREARSCYRHLAGRLGVMLSDGMRARGYVDETWALTTLGRGWYDELGIPLPRRTSRPLLRPCLDWTERREHLAGPAADELLSAARRNGWVVAGDGARVLRVTDGGRAALADVLGAGSSRPITAPMSSS